MDIYWGIGIEHEVLIVDSEKKKELGINIKNKLINPFYDNYIYLNFINSNKLIESDKFYDYNENYIYNSSKISHDLEGISISLEIITLLDRYISKFIQNSTWNLSRLQYSSENISDISTISTIVYGLNVFNDKYLSNLNYNDIFKSSPKDERLLAIITQLFSLNNRYDKNSYTYNSVELATIRYDINQMFINNIRKQSVRLLSVNMQYLILNDLLGEFHVDSTTYTSVPEFVNTSWKNMIIKNSVLEIDLKQRILLLVLSMIYSKDYMYPTIGSIFPVKTVDKFYVDYTGSYHINLSIPYSSSKLKEEEYNYLANCNIIENQADEFLGKLSKYTLKDKYFYYISNNPLQEMLTNYGKSSTTKKYLDFVDKNLILNSLSEYDKTVESYKNSFYEMVFNENISLTDIFIQLTKFTRTPEVNCMVELLILTPTGKLNRIGRINKTSVLKNNKGEYLYDIVQKILEKYLTNDDLHESVLINFIENNSNLVAYQISDKRYGINDNIPEVFSDKYSSKIITTTKLVDSNNLQLINLFLPSDNLHLAIINYSIPEYQNKIINLIEQKVYTTNKIIKNMNLQYNLDLKYSVKNGFHYLHKEWAIAIQWCLPLLLSTFSSCDPFCIGDNNKLSELSFRLFILEYSFINLEDVLNYQLPIDREILSYQKEKSTILDMIKDNFDYLSELLDKDGSDFRVDPIKGFDFGFEIRVFDNFDINNLNNLIEFIFLLADHVVGINKDISNNPFNNQILNNVCLDILKQGWNTRISSDYIHLLNETLNLALVVHQGYMAYDVINDIYVYLQKLYISNGRGIGRYSRYTVNRSSGIKNLQNINKVSWEYYFNNLIWIPNPKTEIRLIIEKQIQLSNSNDELINNLSKNLSSDFKDDIEDIFYALKSLQLDKVVSLK